ncbi:MAG: serine protease [Gammaproteobacteria bacterium]|nr:serine protease [Gammaproteobacteria bacterium]
MRFSQNQFMQLAILAVVFFSTQARADNNIQFLDKAVINRLTTSVYEVVIPKLEGENVRYAKELPFETLSYRQRNEKYHSIGTAFFINDKELLSAAHVFALEYFSLLDNFYIRDSAGKVYKVNKVKKYSSIRDMIVFDLEEYPETINPITLSEHIEIGDTVFSVGNVQGEGISFRAGQVAAFTTEAEYGMWKDIRFTSPASPGNSGGPLVDVDGRMVGLIVKKNSSENHNIAIPVEEFRKLDDKAEFFLRNVSIQLSDEQNIINRDWQQQIDLPKTVDELSSLARNSLNAFYAKLANDLSKKFDADYFPKGERFRAYLRNQQYVKNFGVLQSDADFNKWYLKNYNANTISLQKDQDFSVSKSEISSFHVVIDKPADVSLADFLDDQELIMDNILMGIPLKRTIGAEDIRIVGLGKPEKTETWQDKVGRKWISSLWFLPHIDAFVYSHCLAYPKGAICNIDLKDNDELYLGYLALVKQNYDEIAIGYEGDITDWLEYFSLGESYLPKAFSHTRLKIREGAIKLTLPGYRLQINNNDINENSNIHFHFGYSNTELLAEELLLFEVFPRKGMSSHYRVERYYSPSEFSSDKYKTIWTDVMNKSGDYSGELINNGNGFVVFRVIDSTKAQAKELNGSTIESVYVVACYHDSMSDDIKAQCDAFADGVEFDLVAMAD